MLLYYIHTTFYFLNDFLYIVTIISIIIKIIQLTACTHNILCTCACACLFAKQTSYSWIQANQPTNKDILISSAMAQRPDEEKHDQNDPSLQERVDQAYERFRQAEKKKKTGNSNPQVEREYQESFSALQAVVDDATSPYFQQLLKKVSQLVDPSFEQREKEINYLIRDVQRTKTVREVELWKKFQKDHIDDIKRKVQQIDEVHRDHKSDTNNAGRWKQRLEHKLQILDKTIKEHQDNLEAKEDKTLPSWNEIFVDEILFGDHQQAYEILKGVMPENLNLVELYKAFGMLIQCNNCDDGHVDPYSYKCMKCKAHFLGF